MTASLWGEGEVGELHVVEEQGGVVVVWAAPSTPQQAHVFHFPRSSIIMIILSLGFMLSAHTYVALISFTAHGRGRARPRTLYIALKFAYSLFYYLMCRLQSDDP